MGGHSSVKHLAFTGYTVLAGRILGDRPLPTPDHTPLSQAARVAAWLARKAAAGRPAVLGTSPSSAVRACLAARERGLDIAGTFFRLASEPYTPAKAEVLATARARGVSLYSMAEIGSIGMPCARPAALDDVHLLTDKVMALPREPSPGHGTPGVRRLYFTTLLPSCPKLMINVESDDHGVLEERDCGCPFGDIGLRQHLHTVRSDDKVSSEGMTLLASEVFALVEELLPARFGGHATDYQFVEQEEAGLSRINVVASPRLGRIDEARLVATVCDTLGAASRAHGSMTDIWRQAGAVRVGPPRALHDERRQDPAVAHPARRRRFARLVSEFRTPRRHSSGHTSQMMVLRQRAFQHRTAPSSGGAGPGLGAERTIPRCSRSFRITAGSCSVAISRSRPPQCEHARTSIQNAR